MARGPMGTARERVVLGAGMVSASKRRNVRAFERGFKYDSPKSEMERAGLRIFRSLGNADRLWRRTPSRMAEE